MQQAPDQNNSPAVGAVTPEPDRAQSRGNGPDRVRKAEQSAQRAIEQGKQSLHAAVEASGHNLQRAHTALNQQLQQRPLAATAAAIGVGLVLGLLLGAGRRR